MAEKEPNKLRVKWNHHKSFKKDHNSKKLSPTITGEVETAELTLIHHGFPTLSFSLCSVTTHKCSLFDPFDTSGIPLRHFQTSVTFLQESNAINIIAF